MVLLIRPHEMIGLVSMQEAIEAVEESFREWVRRLGPAEISRLLDERLAPQMPRKVERILMSSEWAEVG